MLLTHPLIPKCFACCLSDRFPCEGTNLFSLYKLHGRVIWRTEGAIRAHVWSGASTAAFISQYHYFFLQTFSSDYISAYMPSPSLYWLLSGNMILQLLLILTKSVNRCFEKNPKFDMAPLLGGTDAVFLSLIHAFSWSVQFFLCLGFILCGINVWKHSLGIPSNGWTGIQRRFFMHTHASLSRNQQGRQLAQFCRMLLIQGFYLHCWCVSTRFVQLHARTCTVILTT